MARLIFEQAVSIDPITGDLRSYWPERWPLHLLGQELSLNGTAFFTVSYQNDPSALEGNCLKLSWLHYYLPEDLEAARRQAETRRGSRYIGIDPAPGGDETADLDYCAGLCMEKIGNRAFLISKMNRRIRIDLQPQIFEDWMTIWEPDFCSIEDTSSKGFVYQAMRAQGGEAEINGVKRTLGVNNGQGSKFAFQIVKPQSRAAGGKTINFLMMAPKFENAQILVPGIMENGQLVVHPDWDEWQNQWTSYPSGHDDLLDATCWATEIAFTVAAAASAGKDSNGQVDLDNETKQLKIKGYQTPAVEIETALVSLRKLTAVRCTSEAFHGGISDAIQHEILTLIDQNTLESLKLAQSHLLELRRLQSEHLLQERQYDNKGHEQAPIGQHRERRQVYSYNDRRSRQRVGFHHGEWQ